MKVMLQAVPSGFFTIGASVFQIVLPVFKSRQDA